MFRSLERLSLFTVVKTFGLFIALSGKTGRAQMPGQPANDLPTPPHGLIEVKEYEPAYALWVLFAVVGLALLLVAFLLWRKYFVSRITGPIAEQSLEEQSPEDLLKLIEALNPTDNVPSDQGDFFFALGMYYRRLIELDMNLNATDMTLSELERSLPGNWNLSEQDLATSLDFFRVSDAVKFGGRRLEEKAIRENYEVIATLASTLVTKIQSPKEELIQ